MIFEAIVRDIHILPTSVIDDVVLHYKQRAVVAAFVDDLRSETFAGLEAERKTRMYQQYAELRRHALQLADTAISALDAELGGDQ